MKTKVIGWDALARRFDRLIERSQPPPIVKVARHLEGSARRARRRLDHEPRVTRDRRDSRRSAKRAAFSSTSTWSAGWMNRITSRCDRSGSPSRAVNRGCRSMPCSLRCRSHRPSVRPGTTIWHPDHAQGGRSGRLRRRRTGRKPAAVVIAREGNPRACGGAVRPRLSFPPRGARAGPFFAFEAGRRAEVWGSTALTLPPLRRRAGGLDDGSRSEAGVHPLDLGQIELWVVGACS